MPTEAASANTANLVSPADESNTLPVSCLPPSSTAVPSCLASIGAASGASSRTRCHHGQRRTTWRHAAVVETAAAGRRVCRKYRRVYIRRLQETEFDKLRRMVPALRALENSHRRLKNRSQQQRQQPQYSSPLCRHVSKVTVIEETIRYIDLLHRKLTDRLMCDENITSSTHVDEKSVAEAAKMAFILTNSNNDVDRCCLGDWEQQSQFSPAVNPLTGDLSSVVKATKPDRFQP